MGNPIVAWNPQPMDVLKARYADAVRDLQNIVDIIEGRRLHPSSLSQHVFDTEDGLRLIISLKRGPLSDTAYIHISASFNPLAKATLKDLKTPEEIEQWVIDKFHQISGITRKPELIGVTAAGVLHWIMERGH